MKKVNIYEPAMCCSTGLCGVSIDPELLRISTTIDRLKKQDFIVERFNLTSAPTEFMKNTVVNDYINEKGVEELPITIVDGEIFKIGKYPTNEEFADIFGIPSETLE